MKDYANYKREDYTLKDLNFLLKQLKKLNLTYFKTKADSYFMDKESRKKLHDFLQIYPNSFQSASEIVRLLVGKVKTKDEFCVMCGKRLKYRTDSILRTHCSLKCANSDSNSTKKIKQTKLERYGNENYNNREKSAITCMERYGRHVSYNPQKAFETRKKRGTLNISNFEKSVKEFIDSLGIENEKIFINHTNFPKCEIDIYIPKLKLGIECNGNYYHSMEIRNDKNHKKCMTEDYHYKKSMASFDRNITLIHIWEDQWKTNQQITKDFLKARLLKITDTEFQSLSIKESYINNKYIISFYIKNKCYHKSIFTKTKNQEYIWDIVINKLDEFFCITLAYSQFLQKFGKQKVIYYIKLDNNEVSLFEKIGFTVIDILPPNKFYTRMTTPPERFSNLEDIYNKYGNIKATFTNYDSGTIIMDNC